ncbi:MAG: glutamate--tRNA ligase [Patescibacteria group bacterium]|nr:glutamate--tRNA ligase [Patescibacteria group bacterium]
MPTNVVTRFAPSPTGYFHAGSYRTALFSCIYARQNGGKFILRIEDTDKERSKKEYEDNIVDSLQWIGLKYDEFYRQSDRTELYRESIRRLMDSGHAYLSKETPTDAGDRPAGRQNREEVIRFRNPNKKVVFDDMIRGRIEFDTTELGDFVIAKSMDEPVFHLVVVVDDADMGITHIIRGEDHISNTPRQILIFEALGVMPPKYAHIPLLLSGDRSKLSKRHGAVPITEYRSRGYLPEAVVNYLALLGWHPSDDKEIMSFDEIVGAFSLDRVQKSGAIFDEEKLKWFNKQYLNRMSDERFTEAAMPFVPDWLTTGSMLFARLSPIIKEKISCLSDIAGLFAGGGELAFVHAIGPYDPSMLLWKKEPDRSASLRHLNAVRDLISGLSEEGLTADGLKSAIWPYAEANGRGNVLWPLRVALTGQERSPDPFVCAYIIGKEESLKRIDDAISVLG